jgi:hypothetical protein
MNSQYILYFRQVFKVRDVFLDMIKKDVIIMSVILFVVLCLSFWLLVDGYDTMTSQKVSVEDSYGELTLDRPDISVLLDVSGNGEKIKVSAETNVARISISGNENKIFLCEGIHNPKMSNSGQENEVIFEAC